MCLEIQRDQIDSQPGQHRGVRIHDPHLGVPLPADGAHHRGAHAERGSEDGNRESWRPKLLHSPPLCGSILPPVQPSKVTVDLSLSLSLSLLLLLLSSQ